MTAEICLMNRHGLVLAADSAITTSQADGNVRRERYYKGANKIFQLSNNDPVAVMIYDSVALYGFPWELLIKDYRTQLDRDGFSSVDEYAMGFFDFIRSHPIASPSQLDRTATIDSIWAAARKVIDAADLAVPLISYPIETTRREEISKFMRDTMTVIENDALPAFISCDDFADDLSKILPEARLAVEATAKAWQLDAVIDFDLASNLVSIAAIKRFWLVQPHTGLVFAGYGRDDYFPSFRRFACHGIVAGKLAVEQKHLGAISLTNHAWVEPFGMSSMMETFAFGLSDSMKKALEDEFNKAIGQFSGDLGLSLATTPSLDTFKEEAIGNFSKNIYDMALKQNTFPLREVIASLSMGELAELAETLINLESIKERMTRPSESVSGPIDVAAVTRHEGVIWIKRKHYFDPALNPRFVSGLVKRTPGKGADDEGSEHAP